MAENFRLVRRPTCDLLLLLDGFQSSSPDGVASALASGSGADAKDLLVNCSNVEAIPEAWRDFFLDYADRCRAHGKRVALVHAEPGLERSWSGTVPAARVACFPDLWSAFNALARTRPRGLGSNFLRTFINSTRKTLRVRAKLEIEADPISVKKVATDRLLGDILGIVEILAGDFACAVVLSFPEATFRSVAGTLEVARELINGILTMSCHVLESERSAIRPQPPRVIPGREFAGFSFGNASALTASASGKTLVVPFQSKAGPFFVEVWFPPEHGRDLLG